MISNDSINLILIFKLKNVLVMHAQNNVKIYHKVKVERYKKF